MTLVGRYAIAALQAIVYCLGMPAELHITDTYMNKKKIYSVQTRSCLLNQNTEHVTYHHPRYRPTYPARSASDPSATWWSASASWTRSAPCCSALRWSTSGDSRSSSWGPPFTSDWSCGSSSGSPTPTHPRSSSSSLAYGASATLSGRRRSTVSGFVVFNIRRAPLHLYKECMHNFNDAKYWCRHLFFGFV